MRLRLTVCSSCGFCNLYVIELGAILVFFIGGNLSVFLFPRLYSYPENNTTYISMIHIITCMGLVILTLPHGIRRNL